MFYKHVYKYIVTLPFTIINNHIANVCFRDNLNPRYQFWTVPRFPERLFFTFKHEFAVSQVHTITKQLVCVLFFQFSGQCAEDMQKTYAEFCSRHLKAVKLYKELLARDKRFQCFIRVSIDRMWTVWSINFSTWFRFVFCLPLMTIL